MTSFPTTVDIKLEVERDPTGPVNQIKNPDGALGGWGWITPAAGSLVESDPDGGLRFKRSSANPGGWDDLTEPWAMDAGQWTRARFVLTKGLTTGSQFYFWSFDFLDAAGSVISSSFAQGVSPGPSDLPLTVTSAARQAPAGTVAARFKFQSPQPGVPTTINDVRAIVTNTSAEASEAALAAVAPPSWRDITSPVTEIRIVREDLNLGTLTATVKDPMLDPASDSLIRPGKRVRVLVSDGFAWIQIFAGTLTDGSTVYRPGNMPDSRVIVTITAADAVAALAAATRPQGVGTIGELPFVLEGCGLPWLVNGSSAQIPSATVVAQNASAKAIDQVSITRDSVSGYAWVDRLGRLIASDTLATATVATLTEDDYGPEPDISFDLSTCINEVTVRLLRTNLATNETVEIVRGPFQDRASVARWGRRSAEFTVQGIPDTDAAALAYAQQVFFTNANPERRVNRVRLPIRGTADVVANKATLDLYERVQVTNAAAGISQMPYVTALEHTITPAGWVVEVAFAREGAVAPPQATPAVQQVAAPA